MIDTFTLPHGAYGLVVPDAVRTRGDLIELLPADVLERGADRLLGNAGHAAALRLLALVEQPDWHEFVSPTGISWLLLADWSRHPGYHGELGYRERTLAEAALDLAGDYHANVNLTDVVCQLDVRAFLAVIDALRIAREGLEP